MPIKKIKKISLNRILLPVSLFLLIGTTQAQLALPGCFTDNMVLQQKANVHLWGTETPGKNVTITTSWNNKTYRVTGDANGQWKTSINTPSYGGPYTITFNDGQLTTLKNILIGEVWVCSGQSNMEMQVSGLYGNVINLKAALAGASEHPEIRMLKISTGTSFTPRNDVQSKTGWVVCDSQTVRDFSAVAYFFAQNLFPGKNVPVGIINSTWGGTVAEAWTSGGALKCMPAYAPFVNAIEGGLTQKKLDADYQTALRSWMDATKTNDPGFSQSKSTWADQGFDDAAWEKMQLPAYWQQAGVPDYNGTMWFRKNVTLPASWAGRDLKLEIDAIDDYDVSYFNGSEIGHTEMFFYKRSYTIPGNLVKAGANTIAIRVFDNGGLGGINKGPLHLSLANDTIGQIDLAGQWAWHKGVALVQLPQAPVQSNSPNRPMLIYNSMIHPILPYTIKGVIWYQGESNASKAKEYNTLFPLLINDWRQKWGQPDFPFYFVQLANFAATDQGPLADWPSLREAQLNTLKVRNTGMAVAIDIGDSKDIHPKNKQEVGRRLALIARAKTYGEKISFSGPLYTTKKITDNKIEISFSNTDKGLIAKGGALTGFTIAGADQKFYPANAVIVGSKVIVSSADVSQPTAVRYAWTNDPVCNLYNGAGLPASPFRTDGWEQVK